MNNFLKQYHAKLTTVGPVFIGNGLKFSKKEYLFLDNYHKIGILDMQKMYAFINRRHLTQQFEKYMLGPSSFTLERWLQMQRIRPQEIVPDFRYVLNCGNTTMERGTSADIYEFVKDPMGRPYVPGSSLKGMFRTLLLTQDLMQNKQNYSGAVRSLQSDAENDTSGRQRYLQKNARQIEEIGFRTLNRPDTRPGDAVNDILSGVVISDSEPLTTADLIMCQKCDLHIDSTRKWLNVIRESIKPGTEIHFTISVDESVNLITPVEIRQAVEIFNDVYYDTFLHAFKAIGRRNDSVYLGGGSGFVTKTVLYPALGKEDGIDTAIQVFQKTLNPKTAREHQHFRDRQYGVSPHVAKLTQFEGKYMMMGECKLSFE